MNWTSAVGKMAPIDLLEAELLQPSICKTHNLCEAQTEKMRQGYLKKMTACVHCEQFLVIFNYKILDNFIEFHPIPFHPILFYSSILWPHFAKTLKYITCLSSKNQTNLTAPYKFCQIYIPHHTHTHTHTHTPLNRFPGGSAGKGFACNMGDLGLTPSWEDPLEKGTATHSSNLAWRVPQTV